MIIYWLRWKVTKTISAGRKKSQPTRLGNNRIQARSATNLKKKSKSRSYPVKNKIQYWYKFSKNKIKPEPDPSLLKESFSEHRPSSGFGIGPDPYMYCHLPPPPSPLPRIPCSLDGKFLALETYVKTSVETEQSFHWFINGQHHFGGFKISKI